MLERVQIKNILINIKVYLHVIKKTIEELDQKCQMLLEKNIQFIYECQSYICREQTEPSICQNSLQQTTEDNSFLK